ncbi:MAG: hypothetical protein HKN29_15605 [Rhodothermales bacterium]|nr:hypothetical protein [Rhodothermales bacterium]
MATYATEIASSGRSKCRGCERSIAKGDVRLGETMMNPRVDRETTFWYHPLCAAYKRPPAILEFLEQGGELEDADRLRQIAEVSEAHPRMARLHVAHVAPSGRATCRACRETIAKDDWRISVVFFEDGYLNPAGYIHAGCVEAYAETTESAMDRVKLFNPELTQAELEMLAESVEG